MIIILISVSVLSLRPNQVLFSIKTPKSQVTTGCNPHFSQTSSVYSSEPEPEPEYRIYALSWLSSHHHIKSTGYMSSRSLINIIRAIPGSRSIPIYSLRGIMLVFNLSLSVGITQHLFLLSNRITCYPGCLSSIMNEMAPNRAHELLL